MRTPPRITAALLAAAGFGILAVQPASAQSTQTVNLGNCSSWSITNNVFSCTSGSTTAGTPSGCSITASGNNVAPGAAVTLTASCSQTAAASWIINGQSVSGATATVSVNPTGTTTYQATPSNGSGNGSPVSVTVNVQTPSTGGGGGNTGGGIGSCDANTPTMTLPMSWPASRRVTSGYSSQVGSFGNGSVLVVKFTTGSSNSGPGQIAGTEYAGTPTTRTAVLSESPCDFSNGLATQSGTSVGQYYVMGSGSNPYGYPVLRPNTTYYWNIKNESNGNPTCAAGTSCSMIVNLKAP